MHHFKKCSVKYARIAQLVEHDLAKVGVAGSSPVSRSKSLKCPGGGMVDTLDLKSNGLYRPWGFKSPPGYFRIKVYSLLTVFLIS